MHARRGEHLSCWWKEKMNECASLSRTEDGFNIAGEKICYMIN